MKTLIVGAGRMGTALHSALNSAALNNTALSNTAAIELLPLAGRGATGETTDGTADVVLLAVPDAEIERAASLIAPGPLVGHCSGATTLAPLLSSGEREVFSLHPLLTVTGEGTVFRGAHAAVAGSSGRAVAAAEALATVLGLSTFEVRDPDRVAYHAAASVASNYLLALEHFAETLAAGAGVPREALAPLVRATVENWAARGATAALTGPVARGDEATVAAQREAVAERMPEHLDLFDCLTAATRALKSSGGA